MMINVTSRKILLILMTALVSSLTAPCQETVIIGKQEWMAQNLDADRYPDGVPIKEAKTIQEWKNCLEHRIGCYCNYDNEGSYGKMYGKLYNYYAVKRGLAPHCWRVATKSDFEKLVATIGADSAGKKLKATHSWSNSWNGTNKSGFGALASGCRNGFGTFSYVGMEGFWWAPDRNKAENGKESGLYFFINYDDKCNYEVSDDFGFSIRCVRDAGARPPVPCP